MKNACQKTDVIPSNPSDFSAYALKLKEEIKRLEDKVYLLEMHRFGASSEKLADVNQSGIFDEAESLNAENDTNSDDDQEIEVKGYTYPKKNRKKQIDLSLVKERQTTIHEISPENRACECCGDTMGEIGEEKTEKLDIIPAKLLVQENIYKKYACKNKECDGKVKQAAVEVVAIPKIKGTMAAVSFIAIKKYLYGIPLYRLEPMFTVEGVVLSRQVMANWMIKLGEALKPVYKALEQVLLESQYIHIDETHLQVLKEEGRKATTKSYAWVRRSGNPNAPSIVLFHYSPTRKAEVAQDLLRGFKGYVQSDDYAGYSSALDHDKDVQRLLCWDHTRRYFKNAYEVIPKDKRQGITADQVLKLISKLYKIEKRGKDLDAKERLDLRLEQSVECLNKIESLCEMKLPSLSSTSLTTKAINYMMDNWDLLQVYTTNPMLNISNCPAEQAIRPFVIGRKNWLFSCTPAGAEASMIIYSLITTAKANDLDPFKYLTKTLLGLPKALADKNLTSLLPFPSK